MGLLLEEPFNPNVNGSIKAVCSCLLDEKPTSECARQLNHWLAWSQTWLSSLENVSVFKKKRKLIAFDLTLQKNIIKIKFYAFSCRDREKKNSIINT